MIASPRRRAWYWFLAWAFVGALAPLAILGAFTIGIFVLPVVLILTAVLATRQGARIGFLGLISGLGVPLLAVAYLNRLGPGNVCYTTPTGGGCDQQWNPWPWLIVGVVLVAAGVALFVRQRRRRIRMGGTGVMQPDGMSPPVPAGWYEDPAGSGAWRWWDGANWTGNLG